MISTLIIAEIRIHAVVFRPFLVAYGLIFALNMMIHPAGGMPMRAAIAGAP